MGSIPWINGKIDSRGEEDVLLNKGSSGDTLVSLSFVMQGYVCLQHAQSKAESDRYQPLSSGTTASDFSDPKTMVLLRASCSCGKYRKAT